MFHACSCNIILTEAILYHGGSVELVRTMNRVGAVACMETAKRMSTQVVRNRIATGFQADLHLNTFPAVSIDIYCLLYRCNT